MFRAAVSTLVQAAWLHSLMTQGSFCTHVCNTSGHPKRHLSARRISSQLQEAGKVSTLLQHVVHRAIRTQGLRGMKTSRGRLHPAIQIPAKLIRAGTALLCTVSPLHHHARGCGLPCMHSERQTMSAHRPAL